MPLSMIARAKRRRRVATAAICCCLIALQQLVTSCADAFAYTSPRCRNARSRCGASLRRKWTFPTRRVTGQRYNVNPGASLWSSNEGGWDEGGIEGVTEMEERTSPIPPPPPPPPLPPDKVRYRARVGYDGTTFSGWQVQEAKHRTVQGELQSVLSKRFNRTVVVVGAGRTDTGVHSRGQAIHFDLPACALDGNGISNNNDNSNKCIEYEVAKLEYAMNRMLPRDVRVWNVSVAPPPTFVLDRYGRRVELAWHAILAAKRKLYSYRIATGPTLDPLDRYTRTHAGGGPPVDIEVLRSTLKQFEGTHDFRAFAGAIEQAQKRKKDGKVLGTVRTVYKVNLVDEGGGNYRIDFYLRGALYRMVRNMVGAALEVSRGRFEQARLLELLHQGGGEGGNTTKDGVAQFARCDNPVKPAKPEGLTLEWVTYDDY